MDIRGFVFFTATQKLYILQAIGATTSPWIQENVKSCSSDGPEQAGGDGRRPEEVVQVYLPDWVWSDPPLTEVVNGSWKRAASTLKTSPLINTHRGAFGWLPHRDRSYSKERASQLHGMKMTRHGKLLNGFKISWLSWTDAQRQQFCQDRE